jgi:hypothetical protein
MNLIYISFIILFLCKINASQREDDHKVCTSKILNTGDSLKNKNVEKFYSCCINLGGCVVDCYYKKDDSSTLNCNFKNYNSKNETQDIYLNNSFQKCYTNFNLKRIGVCSDSYLDTYKCIQDYYVSGSLASPFVAPKLKNC